jgi:hypothetical protein
MREKSGDAAKLAGRPLAWDTYNQTQNAEEYFAESCALYLQDTRQFLEQAESETGTSPLRHAARFLTLWVFNFGEPGDLDTQPLIFQMGEILESTVR